MIDPRRPPRRGMPLLLLLLLLLLQVLAVQQVAKTFNIEEL